jgi:hypothetical protein
MTGTRYWLIVWNENHHRCCMIRQYLRNARREASRLSHRGLRPELVQVSNANEMNETLTREGCDNCGRRLMSRDD